MPRRAPRVFRPALDPLEGRLGLSTLPAAAAVAPALPVLTQHTYDRVMTLIDQAFSDYQGTYTAGSVLSGLATDLAGALMPSPSTASPTDTSSDSTSYTEDGQGDGVYLEAQLRRAVDRLPYGDRQAAPLIVEAWGSGGLSPATANYFRDHFKAMVRQFLRDGISSGEFVTKPASPHSPPRSAGPH